MSLEIVRQLRGRRTWSFRSNHPFVILLVPPGT
jgi:hypothetical protein